MREKSVLIVLLSATLLLIAVAWLRGAEYDEQYTLFLTGHVARPAWPDHAITAGEVRKLQSPHAHLAEIARDLRVTDVHPPLYFWMMAAWRRLVGNSLFAARLASVLCGVATLGLVTAIARAAAIPMIPAVLLTLGCYAFAYTGAIARGFALAQMLSVAGVTMLIVGRRDGRRIFAAGTLLGAATFTNYLAAFVACGAIAWACHRPVRRGGGVLLLAFMLWLPADAWFFIAQRQSRGGQFEPFQPAAAIARLVRYCGGALFGGLPLYVDGIASTCVTTALAVLLLTVLALVVSRWHLIGAHETRGLLATAAIATPLGLLVLGFVFDNTPIELRYLAFATPFVGLLLAGALPPWLRNTVLALQALALLGLATRQETMQPARATATAAAAAAGNGIVLVPRGNDGVGIVGAFATEAPPALRLLVIGQDDTPMEIRARVSGYSRVVLALLDQDAASRATLPAMRQAFADPCWREDGQAFKVLAFDRVCRSE